MSSSYTYTDKVASLVQEAAYLQDNLSSQEGETASAPVSHIDGEELNIPVTLHFFPNTNTSVFIYNVFRLMVSSRRHKHVGCHYGGC